MLKLLEAPTKVVFDEYFPAKQYKDNFERIPSQIYKLGKLEISDQMSVLEYK